MPLECLALDGMSTKVKTHTILLKKDAYAKIRVLLAPSKITRSTTLGKRFANSFPLGVFQYSRETRTL